LQALAGSRVGLRANSAGPGQSFNEKRPKFTAIQLRRNVFPAAIGPWSNYA
jgi:hypothetical protein